MTSVHTDVLVSHRFPVLYPQTHIEGWFTQRKYAITNTTSRCRKSNAKNCPWKAADVVSVRIIHISNVWRNTPYCSCSQSDISSHSCSNILFMTTFGLRSSVVWIPSAFFSSRTNPS